MRPYAAGEQMTQFPQQHHPTGRQGHFPNGLSGQGGHPPTAPSQAWVIIEKEPTRARCG